MFDRLFNFGRKKDRRDNDPSEIEVGLHVEFGADPEDGYTFAVVGESFKNDDGTLRQKIISAMCPGESVLLKREPDNKYDTNAVAVLNAGGRQIGYLKSAVAKWFAPKIDAGAEYVARIEAINKTATDKGKMLGVVVRVIPVRTAD